MKDLKSLRKERGLTLVEAAEGIGISKSALGSYETGARVPRDQALKQIASFYGVEASDIAMLEKKQEVEVPEEPRLCPFKIKRQTDAGTGNVTEWFLACAGKKCMAFENGGMCGRLK